MGVTHQRYDLNVVYTFVGPLNEEAAHQYFDLNYQDYNEVGDALGTVLDMRQMRFRVSGLLVASQRMKGVVFDTPVAFVGNPGSIFLTFLTSLEALSSRGQKRFAFMDSVEDALIWNDRWFVERKLDREAMIGLVTGNPTPPVKRFHEG
jgi:hypothetical protein